MFGRDKSERFQSSLPSPGPGHYDPRNASEGGYQSGTRAGLQGSGRFSADIRDEGSGSFSSPPRRIPSRSGSRAADWTTNRIKDLETELRISKAKIMELQQVVRESNLDEVSKDEMESELRTAKNKLLEQKAVTAQAQREALRAETERKKLESDQANLEMRIRKAEENRKISEAKASEAKYKVTELEKNITKMEDEYDEMEEEYRKEIIALKKRLAAAESSMSRTSQSQDEITTQLTTLRQLNENQKEQISNLEVELGASKAAAESLTAESLAETLVIKAELAVAAERETQKDELIEKLRAEITELNDRLDKILRQKEELEAELASMKEENDKKAQSIAEITEALKKSEEQIKSQDEMVAVLEAKIADLQAQNKTQEDSLKQAEESVNSLTQDLLMKTQDMKSLESKIEGLAQVLGEEEGLPPPPPKDASVGEKLDRISVVIATRNDRFSELEKTKDGQNNEVQHLQNKVATVLREKKAKVGELERQKKEEKSLRRSLAEQEKSINDLNKEMEESRGKMEKEAEAKAGLQAELKLLRLQLGEKTVEITELQHQTEALTQEKAADEDQKEKIISEMKKELETARAELVNNNAAFQDLQSQVEHAGRSAGEKGNEVAILQATLEQLTNERDLLKAALEQLKEDRSDTELQDEITSLKKDLTEALDGKTDAEEVASQALDEKATIEEQLSRSKDLQKTKEATITSQAQELSQLNAEKQRLEEALEAVQSNASEKSTSVSSKVTALQQVLKERDEEIRDLQAELSEVIKGHDATKTSSQKLQAKLSKAENDARQKTTTLQELQQEVKALKQENTDLTRERDQASNASKSRTQEKDKKIQRLEREISILKEKTEAAGGAQTSSKDDQTATIEKLKADLEKQKRKFESQIRSMQTEPKSFKDMRAEVAAAQTRVVQTQNEKETLNKELQATLDRLAFYEGPVMEGEELDEVGMLKQSLREAQKKVSEVETQSAGFRKQLKQTDTMKWELERLRSENSHLSSRTKKLDADVLGLMQASGSNLGHHNQKQKIQYHLKLKTELEEMRKQYTLLAREKFKLEQAIRYLAARADLMSGNPVHDVSGTGIRHPSAAVAPASTKESVVLSTPTAKKHMKWASRGRGTTKSMSAYKPRENMEREIEETQVETVMESEALKRDAHQQRSHIPDNDFVPGASNDVDLAPLAQMDSVENRILSTISSIVHGRKQRGSLME